METPGLAIPTHKPKIDGAFVKSSYASATRFLHKNYNCMSEGPEESTKSLLIRHRKARNSQPKEHAKTQLCAISWVPQENKEGLLAGL